MPSERSSANARAQALELRRTRGEISCAECRRLKLKCDKTIPCSSCVRRGCSGICPNKVQLAQHSNRPTLSDTEKLKKKLSVMSKRLAQLEDALSILQASVSSEQHPLLSNDLLDIKNVGSTPEAKDYTENGSDHDVLCNIDIATLQLSDGGAAESYISGAEPFVMNNRMSSRGSQAGRYGLPKSLVSLFNHFPFDELHVPEEHINGAIASKLPSYMRATSLVESKLESITWFFGVVSREQIYEELLPAVYGANPLMSSNERPPLSEVHPHTLALLLAVFACGATSDLTQESENEEAMLYHYLSRVCLSKRSVFESANLITVQAVVIIGTFDLCSCRDISLEATWRMVSFGLSLAASIGLHREPSRFKLPPKEVQRRRKVFWELVTLDNWRSIASGRPQMFHPSVIDCRFPEDSEASLNEAGEEIPGLPRLKHRFAKEVLFDVSSKLNKTESLKYSEIVACDQAVRGFGPAKIFEQSVLAASRASGGIESPRFILHMILMRIMKDIILLSLHRNFFARALIDDPLNPMRSSFGPSFLSGFRSATNAIRVVKEVYSGNPHLVSRIWPIWAHTLTAAIMLGSVAQTAQCTLSRQALAELESALELFYAAQMHPVARTGLPVLLKMRETAYEGLYGIGAPALQRPLSFRPQENSVNVNAAKHVVENLTSSLVSCLSGSMDDLQAFEDTQLSNVLSLGNNRASLSTLERGQPPGQSKDALQSPLEGTKTPIEGHNLHPERALLEPEVAKSQLVEEASSSVTVPFDWDLSQPTFFKPNPIINDQPTLPMPSEAFAVQSQPTPLDFDVSFDLRNCNLIGAGTIWSGLPSQDVEAWSTIMQDARYFSYPDMPMDQVEPQHPT